MRRALTWCVLSAFWSVLAPLPAHAGHGTGGPVLAIPAEYAKRLLDEGDRPIFVDLRSTDEFRKGRVPRARSLPLTELRRRYAEVPRSGRVILYCACPPLEVQAAYQFLRDQGLPEHQCHGGRLPRLGQAGIPARAVREPEDENIVARERFE